MTERDAVAIQDLKDLSLVPLPRKAQGFPWKARGFAQARLATRADGARTDGSAAE